MLLYRFLGISLQRINIFLIKSCYGNINQGKDKNFDRMIEIFRFIWLLQLSCCPRIETFSFQLVNVCCGLLSFFDSCFYLGVVSIMVPFLRLLSSESVFDFQYLFRFKSNIVSPKCHSESSVAPANLSFFYFLFMSFSLGCRF